MLRINTTWSIQMKKLTLLALSLATISLSASAKSPAPIGEAYYCGTIQGTTSMIAGGNEVQLRTQRETFTVVNGATETTEVNDKLEALKASLQPEQLCVKTLYKVVRGTIYATGFSVYQN
jgi:hypothetical protein